MATTKNLCAQIPIDLHERVSEERERLGQTTSEYIANLIPVSYTHLFSENAAAFFHDVPDGYFPYESLPRTVSFAENQNK